MSRSPGHLVGRIAENYQKVIMARERKSPEKALFPADVRTCLWHELFDRPPLPDSDDDWQLNIPPYDRIVADDMIIKAVARLREQYQPTDIAQFIAYAIRLPVLCKVALSDHSSMMKEFRQLHRITGQFHSVLKKHRDWAILLFSEQDDPFEPLSLAKGNKAYLELRRQISALENRCKNHPISSSNREPESTVRTKRAKASLRNYYVRKLAASAKSKFNNQQRTLVARLTMICLGLDRPIADATMTTILRGRRASATSLIKKGKKASSPPPKRDQTLGGW